MGVEFPNEQGVYKCQDVEIQCELLYDKLERKNQFDIPDRKLRRSLVRGIYAILIAQNYLYIPFMAASLFFVGNVDHDLVTKMIMICFLAMFIFCSLLYLIRKYRRKWPYNYISLILFTLGQGTYECLNALEIQSYWSLLYPLALGQALMGIVLYTKQTKFKFTQLRGFLIMIGVCGVYVAAAFLIDSSTILMVSLRMFIYCWYYNYDIKVMLRAGSKLCLTPDEYVYGAVNIYADFPKLIWYIVKHLVFSNVLLFLRFFKDFYRTEVC